MGYFIGYEFILVHKCTHHI